jgi:hypothetical protein
LLQGAVGEQGGADLAAGVEDAVPLRGAVEEAVADLVGCQGEAPALEHLVGLEELVGAEVAHAEVGAEARVPGVEEGLHQRLDGGHGAIRPVDLVELDGGAPEPGEAELEGAAQGPGPGAPREEPELGGHPDRASALVGQPPEDLLRLAVAVDLGGVEEVEPRLGGLQEGLDGLVGAQARAPVGPVGPVAPGPGPHHQRRKIHEGGVD